MRHVRRVGGFLACMALIAGCAGPVPGPRSVGAWLVYWDLDRGLQELSRHGELFDKVSLFAYELDGAGMPVAAPGTADARPRFFQIARRAGISPWATVVNDVRLAGGSVRLKDATTLAAVLRDPAGVTAHARGLAQRVADDGFAGLDLDYERLPSALESAFRDLVSALAGELAQRGLGLNVLVEPARGVRPAPGSAALTLMAYNEHGPHGGPGARATPRFVAAGYARARDDRDGAPTVALAVGGFSWPASGAVRPLDWASALALAGGGAPVARGPVSEVPHLRLQDGAEVWYEDPRSLEAKWRAARAAGFRHLMLWRLGGNDERLFAWIGRLKGVGGGGS